ncbi:MAG: hypothetical protein KHX03_07840 [Clostridium sp.]|nr:hypothetical protein [Clostridium sp.]
MNIENIFKLACFFLFSIFSFSSLCFAEDFEVGTSSELMDALSRANTMPDTVHKINISSDVSLTSAVNEFVSIELIGQEQNHHNLTLNGYKFTFNGGDKSSKISDLNVMSNSSGSSIVVNNQSLSIDNSTFTGNLFKDNNCILDNNNGNIDITSSSFSGNEGYYGGAFANKGNGFLDIISSTVSNNVAYNGGGIYMTGGNVSTSDTSISNNTATYQGGALYISNGTVLFNNTEILNNSANIYGGAAYIGGGDLTFIGSNISKNFSSMGGGAFYIDKGTVVLSNTTLDDNYVTAAAQGGAIYNVGNLTIQNNSSFSNNKVETGTAGAIMNKGTLNISDTSFIGNVAGNDSGAISNADSATLIINNAAFTANKALEGHGGAVAGGGNMQITNTSFDGNSSGFYGGALSLMYADSVMSGCVFSNNESLNERGGAVIIYGNSAEFKDSNIFTNNTAKTNGGAIYIAQETDVKISGTAKFIGNKAKEGLGGALFVQGHLDINADNPENDIIFSGNTDSSGSNAFHISINPNDPEEIGIVNLNISNGSKIVLADNISGQEGTKLNITGTSSYNDNVFLGSQNKDFEGDITANNINLHFYNEQSGLEAAKIYAANTNFDFMNGAINRSTLNLNMSGGGNSLCIDVDPASLSSDYINLIGDPANMTQLTIRDINVLSDPVQSTTIFDIFDHEKYGTDMALSEKLENSIVYGGLKTYRWALTPKLTLLELGGLNPNIQRYQGATSAAFMNQMLSYDYSLNRTDEIYTNLREQKLATRRLNSYASIRPSGMYADYYYEDGSAVWLRPYVNLETFNLSGASGVLNNQSYGFMLGYDFPMKETKNDWKLFPTIYASYIGSSQQYLDSHMNQNGGYGGFLLSAFKDDFYAGWTINGGGVGVASRYNSGHDDYGIVTAGTALKLAYNWKVLKRFIIQPNFTTAYTFLSPSNLVNFQNVDMNQSQVNGLTISPSLRLTYRNENGFEPYIYGGCVIPLMSDIKATGNGLKIETLTLNTWAQFGAGVRKRLSERITCFLETVIRTGGREGWGLMFNIQIAI